MAGFGSLGGLGGYAPSYNMRMNDPNSQVIQSDNEISNEFDDWYTHEAKRLSRNSRGNADIGGQAGRQGYNAYRAQGGSNDDPLYNNQAAWEQAGRSAYRGGRAVANINGQTYNFSNLIADSGPIEQGNDNANAGIRAEMARRRGEFDDTMRLRGENTLRQQQAYTSLSGNNQFNGMIQPDYTSPNFGQVSGQGGATIPQIPGVDMDWLNGLNGAASPGTMGAWGGTFNPTAQTGTFGAPQARKWGL